MGSIGELKIKELFGEKPSEIGLVANGKDSFITQLRTEMSILRADKMRTTFSRGYCGLTIYTI